MSLDPQVKTFLDNLASQKLPKIDELPIDEIRERARQEAALLGEPQPVASIEDCIVPVLGKKGESGIEVPIRVYRPDVAGPLGAYVYFHGGGWVTGEIETRDGICCELANLANCVVISVG